MSDRSQLILDLLERQGTASYEDIAKLLKVSSMTVRRECDALAQSEKIIKTVGGIQRANAPANLHEGPVGERLLINHAEKQAIASSALELIGEQHTIYLDGSTTCLELAKLLSRDRSGLTVVTNSALICLEMSRGRNLQGEIGVESEPGNGATFWFAAYFEKQPAALPAHEKRDPLAGTRALIINANGRNHILELHLANLGMRFSVAFGWQEGLELLRSEALREIRSAWPLSI